LNEPIVETSAGGVLFKPNPDGTQVCLIQVATRGGNPSWRLPKGTIEYGETPEEAACRETREETGCSGNAVARLSPIEYWYTRPVDGSRQRVKKVVEFYLMEYTEGETSDHDHEVIESQWMTLGEAMKAISYDAESRVLQEAIHAWDAHLYRLGLL
jgi:8-oxo-dGTP pyrophosphatase MutT (NUDIX family)